MNTLQGKLSHTCWSVPCIAHWQILLHSTNLFDTFFLGITILFGFTYLQSQNFNITISVKIFFFNKSWSQLVLNDWFEWEGISWKDNMVTALLTTFCKFSFFFKCFWHTNKWHYKISYAGLNELIAKSLNTFYHKNVNYHNYSIISYIKN